jgi:hypothetical protein
MLLLPSILANSTRPPQQFVLLQSSTAQSSLPILQNLITRARGDVLLICYLYPSKIFSRDRDQRQLHIVDLTGHVPYYHNEVNSWREHVQRSLQRLGTVSLPVYSICVLVHSFCEDSSLPLTVVVDSLETLLSNASNSTSLAYAFVVELLTFVQTHKGGLSTLIHRTASDLLSKQDTLV